jgi:hypothetical protein
MRRLPAPEAVVHAWITGPNSEAGTFFSPTARYHYPRDVADWFTSAGPHLWRPTVEAIDTWAVHYRDAARSRDRATATVRSFYHYAERYKLCPACGYGYAPPTRPGEEEPPAEAGIDPGSPHCPHRHSSTLVPAGTYAHLRRCYTRHSDNTPGREYLDADQARALLLAAARFRGRYAERTRAIVYLLLSNFRPGQITAMRLEGRHDEQHRVTWDVPQKNAARYATLREEIPREVVLAIDEYLPHREARPPHSLPDSGPLLTSRLGRPLDRVNSVLRGLRSVASTHPDLVDLAPTLSADAVAHSPSPFVRHPASSPEPR